MDSTPEPPLVPASEPERRVLPVERLGAAIEVLLCSGLATQLLIISVLIGFGLPLRTDEGRLSPVFVFTLSFVDTALVLSLVFFFLRTHRESARQVLLGRRPLFKEALLGILLAPLMLVLMALLLAAMYSVAPELHNVPRNPLQDLLLTRSDALVFAVVVLIAGGVREEVQRGFVLRRFEQYLGGGALGLVVFSALFGLGHVDQGADAVIATAVLGAFWGVIYLRRRSIVAAMVSHGGFNLAQILTAGQL